MDDLNDFPELDPADFQDPPAPDPEPEPEIDEPPPSPRKDAVTRYMEQWRKKDALTMWVPAPAPGTGKSLSGPSVDSAVAAHIQRAVQSGVFPWRTVADFVRFAVMDTLARNLTLARHEGFQPTLLKIQQLHQSAVIQRRNNDVLEAVQTVLKTAHSFLALDRIESATDYVRGVRRSFQESQDEMSLMVLGRLRVVFEEAGARDDRVLRVWLEANR